MTGGEREEAAVLTLHCGLRVLDARRLRVGTPNKLTPMRANGAISVGLPNALYRPHERAGRAAPYRPEDRTGSAPAGPARRSASLLQTPKICTLGPGALPRASERSFCAALGQADAGALDRSPAGAAPVLHALELPEARITFGLSPPTQNNNNMCRADFVFANNNRH